MYTYGQTVFPDGTKCKLYNTMSNLDGQTVIIRGISTFYPTGCLYVIEVPDYEPVELYPYKFMAMSSTCLKEIKNDY